ncbi:hypothetical protein CEUSTIGMA_g5213.t1 [Chlamydomonas eustigma]|uniref:CCT domain-containing protein n=1 Tax=Chlamydomonas eustigma TaxID=1157962 RepID=A0A250X4T0_9CHLO|nr:hypothetical protein CEUSTIGMA_g5213.t1 [Chlamydomonas eustigma]|eukprot:GAX77770.1 hypothetical protein CEUSTIGMA_g5213.t1 [Chlamydomonas eustigma]
MPNYEHRQNKDALFQQTQSGNKSVPILTPSPKNLRVLVVDSKLASRLSVVQLLRDCQYQVHSVKTSKDALTLLASAAAGNIEPPFDIILKEHEPDGPNPANGCRFLRQMARTELLAKIPVVDFLIKPLRHNELRHIWTRVWWWRRSGLGSPSAETVHKPIVHTDTLEFQISTDDSQDTKCDDDDEPTSKEGSAPDNGNGSNENGNSGNENGSNGNGNGTSRVEAKGRDGNGNGSSGNNGNSATKHGHHNGSNGNGNSTTLAEHNALVNTAEGKAPPNDGQEGMKAGNRSSFQPYVSMRDRKRPASALGDGAFTSSEHLNDSSTLDGPNNKQSSCHHTAVNCTGGALHVEGGIRLKQAHEPLASPSAREQGSGSSSGGGMSRMTAKPAGSLNEMHERLESVAAVGTVSAGMTGGVCIGTRTGSSSEWMIGSSLENTGPLSAAHNISEDTKLRGGLMIPTGNSGGSGFPHQSGGSGFLHQSGGSGFLHQSGAEAAFRQSSGGPALGGPAPMSHPNSALSQHHPPGWMAPGGMTLQKVQAAMMHGGANLHQPFGSVGYPGSIYSAAGHMVGFPQHLLQQVPPQVLQQMHPLALQSLYWSALQASQVADAAAGSQGGGLVPPSVLLAMQGQKEAAAAAAAAAEVARTSGLHQSQLLGGLGVDVAAAAAIAAAVGNLNPLLLLQYPALQAGTAASAQLQQLAVAHQAAGSAASVAAWHAAAAAASSAPSAPPSHQVLFAAAAAGLTGGRVHSSITPEHSAPSATNVRAQILSKLGVPMGSGNMIQSEGVAEEVLIEGLPSLGLPRLSTLAEPRKRRAMALDKYRKKRKNLKFAKTIRYESRKQLAQSRPRIKGQFVKHVLDEPGLEGSGAADGEGDEDTDMRAGCEEDGQGGPYGGQNFNEEGEYDREEDECEIEEDEEGGAGGSGTEAGGGGGSAAVVKKGVEHMHHHLHHHREADPNNSSPEAEQTPQQEDYVPEEEDNVVNSLRKLREGPPQRGYSLAASADRAGLISAAAASVGGSAVGCSVLPSSRAPPNRSLGMSEACQNQGGGGSRAVLSWPKHQLKAVGEQLSGHVGSMHSVYEMETGVKRGSAYEMETGVKRGSAYEMETGVKRGSAYEMETGVKRGSAATEVHGDGTLNGKNGSDSGSNSPDENGGADNGGSLNRLLAGQRNSQGSDGSNPNGGAGSGPYSNDGNDLWDAGAILHPTEWMLAQSFVSDFECGVSCHSPLLF